ncbi:MAG: hypothetical protein J6Y02_15200 [Pseudobutyrivibrio sp.]|nr:hypothetical protein [Pseudobutyrivibrio sp.]
MDYLKLKVEDNDIVEVVSEGDVKLSFDGVIAFCMSFMEHACTDYLRGHENDAEDLYDTIDYIFYKFMERTFPDIQPREFDLSDAGMLYAQDMIINEANKKGLTYEEALQKYENKAKEYVKQKARLMA